MAEDSGRDRRIHELTTLKVIAETLNRAVDIGVALDEILPLLVELMHLQTGWLFLYDAERDRFEETADIGLPPALAARGKAPLRHGNCYCQDRFREGRLEAAVNIIECSRLAGARGDRAGLVVHASVPLRAKSRLLGILNVASPGNEPFDPQDLELLSAVGYQIGTALENARLHEERRRLAALAERQRVARDLHDTVSQRLFSLSLTAEAARDMLPAQPERARETMATAAALARQALAEMRSLIHQLRPSDLQDTGLAGALEQHIASLRGLSGLDITLHIAREPHLEPRTAEALLRVAQEALHNVLKHARAHTAEVTLEERRGPAGQAGVRLTVRDDGVGFAVEAAPERRTLGLINMRERIEALGGRFTIESAPGQGSVVRCWVPRRRGQGRGRHGAGTAGR